MKKVQVICVAIICLLLLSSCNTQKEKQSTIPKMLDVNLSISPEKGKVNQAITFKALVTQGKEKVNDADEVKFEIWRSMDQNHEQINIKNGKEGVYSLTKTFGQEGTYYVISHVTARGMHTMPKKKFVIGQPSQEESSKTNNSMEGMDMK